MSTGLFSCDGQKEVYYVCCFHRTGPGAYTGKPEETLMVSVLDSFEFYQISSCFDIIEFIHVFPKNRSVCLGRSTIIVLFYEEILSRVPLCALFAFMLFHQFIIPA